MQDYRYMGRQGFGVRIINIFLFCICVSLNANATILNQEIKIYQRCYALLTSARPAAGDALITQIKAGTLTGAAACMQRFDQAQLGSNNKVNTSDPIALNIIRKMHEVHRSFFEIKDYTSSIEFSTTANVIDHYEAANSLTYLLLKPNQPFSNIVTASTSHKALRYSTRATTKLQIFPAYNLSFTEAGAAFTPSVLVREGQLNGIEPDTTVNSFASFPAGYTNNNINAHKGGGIMGSQAYMLANGGTHYGNITDGGILTYRRWGKNVIKDLLCRDLPSLRQGDASGYVVPTSTIPYRKSESCVMCHASMDQVAGTLRNQLWKQTSTDGYGIRFFATFNTNLAASNNFPSEPDPNFYRRPPAGKLTYRSYDGALVNLDVTSLPDLGSKMAATEDLYICAAKHYYQFLTGIDANLADLGNPVTPTLTSGELFHRNKVINLGLTLKQDLSLRELFRRIIESDSFKFPERGQ